MKPTTAVRSALTVVLTASILTRSANASFDLYDTDWHVGVSVPSAWESSVDGNRQLAASEDRQALVMLVPLTQTFEHAAVRLDQVLDSLVFQNVEIDAALIRLHDDRGGFVGAVTVEGHGQHRWDSRPANLYGVLVHANQAAALVIGAWKEERHEVAVRTAIDSVYRTEFGMQSTRRLRHKATAVSVRTPAKWSMRSTIRGFETISPDETMTASFLMNDDDYDRTTANIATLLQRRNFYELELEGFTTRPDGDHGFQKLVVARGRARLNPHGIPRSIVVMVGRLRPDQPAVVLVATWARDAGEPTMREVLASLAAPGG